MNEFADAVVVVDEVLAVEVDSSSVALASSSKVLSPRKKDSRLETMPMSEFGWVCSGWKFRELFSLQVYPSSANERERSTI